MMKALARSEGQKLCVRVIKRKIGTDVYFVLVKVWDSRYPCST
jgi:hypothetical protein